MPAAKRPSAIAAVIVLRKPRVTCCAVATGTTISALISSTPTARIAMVTVIAVVTAISRLRVRTGRPETLAYSSSWLTAKSAGRSAIMATRIAPPRITMVVRSVAEMVVSDPNR